MSVLVKALGYYSYRGGKVAAGMAKLRAHLKYLEHGKIHRNEPVGFDQERDSVDRREFMDLVRGQPERGVIAHKLVISLSEDERNRLGVSMCDLVRETMAAYESRQGRTLCWIAFEHDDPGHSHVHVVIAGYDQAGKSVAIFPKDLDALRRIGDRERDRLAEWSRLAGRAETHEPEHKKTPARKYSTGVLDRVLQAIRELMHREEQQRQVLVRRRVRERDSGPER